MDLDILSSESFLPELTPSDVMTLLPDGLSDLSYGEDDLLGFLLSSCDTRSQCSAQQHGMEVLNSENAESAHFFQNSCDGIVGE